MSRTARALRSTLVVSLFGYAAQALSLVAIPVFLHTIGAEAYGLMVTVMAFMGYLGFADAGLSWGAMILVAQADGRGDRVAVARIVRHAAVLALGSTVLAMVLLAAVLLAARAGWRLPMFAAHPEADRLLLLAGAQVALNLQCGVVYNLFQGLQESHWAGLYQGLARLLGLAGALGAAVATGDVAAMLAAQLGASAAAGLAALWHARRRHPWAFAAGTGLDPAQLREQLRAGGMNLLLQVGRTLIGTAPTLAISAVAGPAWVPWYTIPTTLFGLFLSPLNTWSATLQSAYGEAHAAGSSAWMREAFRRTLERALVWLCLGIALFFALGDAFVATWTQGRLGIPAAMAASVVAIGSLGVFLQAGQYLLVGLNRHRPVALAEVAAGLLALLLVPVAVRQLGVGAVGIGLLAAVLPTSGWVLARCLDGAVGPDFLPGLTLAGKAVLAGVAGGLAAWGVMRGAPAVLPFLNVALAAAAGLLLFAGAARLSGLALLGGAGGTPIPRFGP